MVCLAEPDLLSSRRHASSRRCLNPAAQCGVLVGEQVVQIAHGDAERPRDDLRAQLGIGQALLDERAIPGSSALPCSATDSSPATCFAAAAKQFDGTAAHLGVLA